jgi:hypothetical protein
MAIATLSTYSVEHFKGGRRLTGRDSSTSLVGVLNVIVAKVNAVIAAMNAGTLDVLDVGSGTGAYYGTSDSWINVDGTNPPSLSAIRFVDTVTGAYRTVTIDNGVVGIV